MVPRKSVSAIGALAVLATSWVATSASPHNVLLARGRTEPILAVDPRHPATIFVASNTNYSSPVGGALPDGYFVSHDGGRSFGAGVAPVTYPFTTEADPSVGIGATGTLFLGFLAETPTYCSGGSSAVMVSHSTDGGRSFRQPATVDTNSADDKPLMAVEDTRSRFAHIFVVWTRWHAQGNRTWSDIWVSRSLDGGTTFSPARMLYSSSLDNFGPLPVVAPHKHIYVFWSNYPDRPLTASTQTRILMASSNDDGRTFSSPRPVAGPFVALPAMENPGALRNLTAPTAVASGKNIFLSWAASRRARNGSYVSDIEVSRSRDGGKSWSRAVRANDSRQGDRFMPAIASLRDGSVALVFYDRRISPSRLDVFAARVTFGRTVKVSSNVHVNDVASPVSDIFYIRPGSTCFSPGRFFGDYIGAAPCGTNQVCTVWADTQLHVPNETELWFARVTLPSLPTTRVAGRTRPPPDAGSIARKGGQGPIPYAALSGSAEARSW